MTHPLTAFLLARIKEDEKAAVLAPGATDLRDVREALAKRAVLAIHSDRDGDCARCSDYAWFAVLDGGEREEFPCPTLKALAAVYSDHPDYLQEWKP